jgi:carbohydrate-selective porin OprB
VRLQWKITPQWSVRGGAYSGAVGQQDRTNRHGTRFRFESESGGFYFGEIEHDYGDALPGSIKVGGYYNNGLQDDFSDAGKRERGLGAFYGIVEQAIYRPPKPAGKSAPDRDSKPDDDEKEPGIHLFLEVGDGGPEDRTLVAWETELGIVAQGMLFGREHDRFGLAFGLTHLGKDVAFVDGERVTAHHESMIEATYQFEVQKHLLLQPDVQVIFNPGAATRAATAVVVGLRAVLSF